MIKLGNHATLYTGNAIEILPTLPPESVNCSMSSPLKSNECIHHLNHNTQDNRIENLVMFNSNKEHKQYEAGHDISPIWEYKND